MKKGALILLMFVAFKGISQEVMKVSDSKAKYTEESLNKIYFNRVMSDEIMDEIGTSTDYFIHEWSLMTKELAKYLQKNNFKWGKPTKAQIEVYFNKDEKIELFFISVRDNELSEEKYATLFSLIRAFAKEYTFTIDSPVPFSNSGSVNFVN